MLALRPTTRAKRERLQHRAVYIGLQTDTAIWLGVDIPRSASQDRYQLGMLRNLCLQKVDEALNTRPSSGKMELAAFVCHLLLVHVGLFLYNSTTYIDGCVS